MATNSSGTLSGATVARLGRLIVACNDDARAQSAAAVVVGGPRGASLDDAAARRGAFAHELEEVIRSFGGRPGQGTSAFEDLRAAVHAVNVLAIGENPGDSYASCARIEAKTQRLYERAASETLPATVTEVLTRHSVEIARDHAELRRLSMGG